MRDRIPHRYASIQIINVSNTSLPILQQSVFSASARSRFCTNKSFPRVHFDILIDSLGLDKNSSFVAPITFFMHSAGLKIAVRYQIISNPFPEVSDPI